MANLENYILLKRKIEQYQEKLSELEANKELQQDLIFLAELEELLERYGKSKEQTAKILFPESNNASSQLVATKPRKKREAKTYVHPVTGETVTTAGGNHTILKKWRAENPDVDLSEWIVP